jgi:predicted HD superfamily hydrolase involved in NAD metabolism
MTKTEIYESLKKRMTQNGVLHPRFLHSVGVAETALKLNDHYSLGLDESKVYLAGLLHDCAKLDSKDKQWELAQKSLQKQNELKRLDELKKAVGVWHGFAGEIVAEEDFGITDSEILLAIRYHTTGRRDMTPLEKIIFVSDYIEPNRVGKNFDEVRKITFDNLDEGIKKSLEETIHYLESHEYYVYYLTFDTYHQYLEKGNHS